ncbi:MAG: VTT domain-containing protein [Gammaproteobacteria bacterium]|nr:VTT domain-containing protein [Gammaproteobacteria bacterium]
MESLHEIFAWINAHPGWGGVGVFLIAFFESLALVGLILPGAAMMFGIGALVGTDVLPLGPTLVWAAAGAIAGDGASFWLGRHYHMQLKTMWPLRKHPELIANATQFFYRHGGKSILFGRFIGPIRPVIPAVAGMLEMPTRRFVLFNVLSGLLWAPVYVLPGMIFTTSLGLAAEVASRLAVMVGSMLAVVVLVLWLSRLAFNWLHRRTYPLMQRLLWWSRLHPLAGRIPASLLDPELPEARGLTLLALLLLGTTLLFSVVMVALGEGAGLLGGLDYTLHHTLQQLRTPAMDRLMLLFARLGEIKVLLSLSLLVLLWLLHCGFRRAALHWLAAAGFGALLGLALFALGHQLHAEALTQHAADNSLLLGVIACFGFLAVLIARELPLRQRWWVYALTGVLLLTIAFARLYLGIQHLGALIGVLLLGLSWVALLGIGYRNHPAERVAPLPLLLLALVVIATSMAWQAPPHLEESLQRYAAIEERVTLSPVQWLNESPETTTPLPTFRADLRGLHRHPLNLQYVGALDALRQSLMAAGWRQPPKVDLLSWLVWLNPNTPLAQLPVLPQVHDGRYHELLLSREVDGQLLALRLWRSPYRLAVAGDKEQGLWLGSISYLAAESRGGLTVPRTQQGFDEALRHLSRQLASNPAITLYPPLSRATAQAVLRFTLRGTLWDS